jgi:hypothetical protein
VVPYNPYLSLFFNCHINVEVCSSIAIVKYLYKYVYKGHDRAQVDVGPVDAAAPDGGAPLSHACRMRSRFTKTAGMCRLLRPATVYMALICTRSTPMSFDLLCT